MELAHRLVASRTGTAVLALLAAVTAGAAVLVYVHHYRSSVTNGGTPAKVLVATKPIPKGMSIAAALSAGYVETQTMRVGQLADGALASPAGVRDNVATRNVLPGEQLTTATFGTAASGLAAQLTGSERAVAVALNQPQSLAGQLQTGDHVDVLVGFTSTSLATGIAQPIVKTLLQDVPVLSLKSPGSSLGSQNGTNVLLQVTSKQAAKIAYATQNGKIWLVLRPQVDAAAAKPSLVTLRSLLLGTTPVLGGGK